MIPQIFYNTNHYHFCCITSNFWIQWLLALLSTSVGSLLKLPFITLVTSAAKNCTPPLTPNFLPETGLAMSSLCPANATVYLLHRREELCATPFHLMMFDHSMHDNLSTSPHYASRWSPPLNRCTNQTKNKFTCFFLCTSTCSPNFAP